MLSHAIYVWLALKFWLLFLLDLHFHMRGHHQLAFCVCHYAWEMDTT